MHYDTAKNDHGLRFDPFKALARADERRLWKMVELPAHRGHAYTVVFGSVVGVYIDDAFIKEGIVDTGAMQPIARMGYMQYCVVRPDTVFGLNRPEVAPGGITASVPGEWDGVYR